MALNDLTPQLRTRLSRMERAVGWFVVLATALLVFGFVYYLKVVAERKGWFIKKITYKTAVQSGSGLKVGDPVKLMGFDVGQITAITPNDPGDYYNITVSFYIKDPHYGYLWSDSEVKVQADFLGHRLLEVTKGTAGVATILETNKTPGKTIPIGILKLASRDTIKQLQTQLRIEMLDTNKTLKGEEDITTTVMGEVNRIVKANLSAFYTNLTDQSFYWLDPAESPALNDRIEAVISSIEKALPNFLALTNTLTRALTNLSQITTHADELLVSLKPTASNLVTITENIRDPHGSLGEWLIPTNLNQQLTGTLSAATGTLNSAHTNLDMISTNVTAALENLSQITSNLNAQVQANSNILSSVSSAVVHTDEFVQGLKRHWLLRSAFKSKTNPVPAQKLRPPKN